MRGASKNVSDTLVVQTRSNTFLVSVTLASCTTRWPSHLHGRRTVLLQIFWRADWGLESEPNCVAPCLGAPAGLWGPDYSLPLFWWCGHQPCLPVRVVAEWPPSPDGSYPDVPLLSARPWGTRAVSHGWDGWLQVVQGPSGVLYCVVRLQRLVFR